MVLRYYANAPATTLGTSCTAISTTIQVASATGFPAQFPYVLILDKGAATEEVVEVTNASGTTLTVTRGADSTTAFSHAVGADVVHGFSARDIREPNSHVNASAGVHGVSGSVVGTTDTQAVTNKTLSMGSNTINGLAATKFVQSDSTGKLVAGASLPSGQVVGTTDTQTLTNKTLTSPTINAPAFGATDGSLVPPGTLLMYGAAAPPTGFLLCDGAAVSRTTYANLFAAVGTNFGAGNGSTTFNVPDMRARRPIGFGGAATSQTDIVGRSDSVALAQRFPWHNHGQDDVETAQTALTTTIAAGTGTLRTIPHLDHTHHVSNTGTQTNQDAVWMTLNFIIKH